MCLLFKCLTVCFFVSLFAYFLFLLNGVPARGRRRHEERGGGQGEGGALLGEGVAALAHRGRLAAVGGRGVGTGGRGGRGWQGLGLVVRGLGGARGDEEGVLPSGRRGGRQREGRGGHAGPGGEEGVEGGSLTANG